MCSCLSNGWFLVHQTNSNVFLFVSCYLCRYIFKSWYECRVCLCDFFCRGYHLLQLGCIWSINPRWFYLRDYLLHPVNHFYYGFTLIMLPCNCIPGIPLVFLWIWIIVGLGGQRWSLFWSRPMFSVLMVPASRFYSSHWICLFRKVGFTFLRWFFKGLGGLSICWGVYSICYFVEYLLNRLIGVPLFRLLFYSSPPWVILE